jgi:hypothetical protein
MNKKENRMECKYCGYDTFTTINGIDICIKCKKDWYGKSPKPEKKVRIEEIKLKHFPERIVRGVRMQEYNILTDDIIFNKINEIIQVLNSHK